MKRILASLSPRVVATNPDDAAALATKQPTKPSRDVVPLYRADPEAFAAQMEVFERMRETERAFKGERP